MLSTRERTLPQRHQTTQLRNSAWTELKSRIRSRQPVAYPYGSDADSQLFAGI